MIGLNDITVHYRRLEHPILLGASVTLPQRGLVTCTGPSGSGKSSVLNVLGGLLRPTHGTFIFEGQDLVSASSRVLARYRARHVGFVFQAAHLLKNVSALANVELGARYRLNPRPRDARKEARLLLSNVGLAERHNHRPHELSGGERQRVAIARAMMGNPTLLLADEPTGNLDPQMSATVVQQLLSISQSACVVLVTHNPEIAALGEVRVRIEDRRLVA